MSTEPAANGPLDLTAALAEVTAVTGEHAARTDRDAEFPVEALDALRSTGLLGLMVPAAHGGLGGTVADLVAAAQTLGRSDMSVGMIFAMHCQQAEAIVRYGDRALRDELLPDIAKGGIYLASVTTEAGKGGHLLSAQAQLTGGDGQLVIDRFAPVVTGGGYADGFLITMRSPGAVTDSDVSLVYAHRSQLGISGSGEWQPMGMRASHSGALKLSGSVPPAKWWASTAGSTRSPPRSSVRWPIWAGRPCGSARRPAPSPVSCDCCAARRAANAST